MPYSLLVSYYYVSSYELTRYTRSYPALRGSWERAFSFVEEVMNMATTNPKEFVQKWIKGEISTMMKGLGLLIRTKRVIHNRYLTSAGQDIADRIHRVRNMNDKTNYGVYGEEMDMAIKAEKVSGAVSFLDNLTELSKELPEIESTIEKIKKIASSLLPDMERMIEKIGSEIKSKSDEKNKKEKSLIPIKNRLKPHERVIKRLKERALYKLNVLDSKDIELRTRFRDTIMECRKKIEDAGIYQAA